MASALFAVFVLLMFAISLAVVNSDSAINEQKVLQEKVNGEQQQKTKEEKVNSRPNANLKVIEQPKERPFFSAVLFKIGC
ncbi:hypothetical protein niasHT_038277 [Heterodera trifolii]|uniref:Uncharacterized protein n=1 Tax=Heterodera trifolii TaxID=157864 RepID=A0ABD2HW21_9BILA